MNPYSDLSERDQLTKNDIIEMWCQDLEEHPESQGQGYLQAPVNGVDKFCCLGRLCYIASLYGVVSGHRLPQLRAMEYGRSVTLTPDSVMRWAGLRTTQGIYRNGPFPGYKNELTHLNDAGVPFSKIAEVIRARPEGLFV